MIDTRVLIDQDVKKKWETAKDEKGKMAVLVTFREKVLQELNHGINGSIGDLAQLVERYSYSTLSGGFLAQLDKTVTLLEQHHTALKGKCVDQDQIHKVEESLDHTRMKLELLINAKESARKENKSKSVGIKSKVKEWLRL